MISASVQRTCVVPALLALAVAVVALPRICVAQDGAASSITETVVAAPNARRARLMPAGYVGSDRCANCHRAPTRTFMSTVKGRQLIEHPRNELEKLGCEGCHGPGEAHVAVDGRRRVTGFISFKKNDPTPLPERNAVCLRCHEGTQRMDWMGSQHETRDVACTDCHTVMAANSERHHMKKATVMETCGQCHQRQMRSQQLSVSRMPVLEGKMQCNNCHNPHGSPNEKLLVAATLNETCYSCHAEKSGPVLWEHAPVVESCANCHDSHGGRHEKMLTMPKPRLCQQCHIESRHPTDPQRLTTASVFLMNRSCVNCHALIHGSNHPGGNRFQR